MQAHSPWLAGDPEVSGIHDEDGGASVKPLPLNERKAVELLDALLIVLLAPFFLY